MGPFIKEQDWDYEVVAASQTTQILGPGITATRTPSTQFLSHLVIIPETTAAGTVAIKDGSDTAVNVFVAGTLSNLQTFVIPLRMMNITGAWQVTTGANVHVIAVGRFT